MMNHNFTFTHIIGEYDYIGEYHEGLAFVRNNIEEFKVGYIDKTGNVIIQLDYYGRFGKETFVHYNHFSEGLAPLINKDGKFGYLNKIGEVAIPFEYDFTYVFKDGLAAVKKTGKWGFIDKTGCFVIPLKYDAVRAGIFYEGRAAVSIGGKWGYIDRTGAELTPFTHDYVDIPEAAENSDKSKNISNISPFDEVSGFREGVARVKKDGKYGCIDKTGSVIIPIEYDCATNFSEGIAVVKKDGVWMILRIEA